MKPSSMPWLAFGLHLALGASLLPAQATTGSQPTAADIDAELRRFRALPTKTQEQALAAVRSALEAVDDPYLHSIRAMIARLQQESGGPPAKLETKKPVSRPGSPPRGDRPLWQSVAFPVRQEYVFGRKCVVARHATAATSGSQHQRAADAREAELRALLYGFPPDLDLAMASVLRDLDHDRRADALSRVLETWRAGDESFYRTLDRTAGTEEAVFFYDAMLADFLRECVPSRSPDSKDLHENNAAAHAALHAAFLSYRQYRGLREAAALALLLPPDEKLPGPLARYEGDQPGSYSVREVVTLLLADAEQDLSRVVELVKASAPPLPEDLWRGYEPLPALYAAFDQHLAAMVERAGHTDRLLEEQTKRRAALHDRLARVAFDALPR